MKRHVAAVVVIVCLASSVVHAQTTTQSSAAVAEIRISTPSATIYRSPSTGSPALATVRRGTVVTVTRELGSWVQVSWPDAQGGSGYMHVSSGAVTHAGSYSNGNPGLTQAPSMSATSSVPMGQSTAIEQPRTFPGTVYVARPSHLVGLGGKMMGQTLGYGVSGRVWSRGPFGVQIDLSRSRMSDVFVPEQVTMVQFAPSMLYSLPDRVTDYVWVRPYVGAGASMNRHTFRFSPEATESISDNTFGFRAFGGGELTFASMPRFSVSADLGYDWSDSPFVNYDFGGFGFAVSAHWYVK
jgi:opacity protein-like surface antigen